MQRKRPLRLKKRYKFLLHFIAWCIVIALGFAALDNNIRPVVTTMAQYQCRSASVDAINKAVQEVLEGQDDLYGQIVNVKHNENGAVSVLTVNTVAENQFKAILTQAVSDKLKLLKKEPVEVPLGTLLGWQLMAGRGPDITMQILPSAFVQSNTSYTFESAGINQTHHRIFIEFTVEMSAILPGYSTSATVETQICIAQTLIVGNVPEFYAGNGVISAR